MNHKSNLKKLTVTAIFAAIAVVGSLFSFPVFGSKCAPVQHLVNVLCAVLVGPWWGLAQAFIASLIRNLLAWEVHWHFREVCAEHFLADSFINMERNSHLHISVR